MTILFRGAILGAPGSGKGTISKKIVETFDVVHISTGDIFRQSIAAKSELGESVKKFIREGKLVPDSLVLKLVLDNLNKLSARNWICDGFPRTLHQAEELFSHHPLHMVINLKVPFEEIVKRVKGRLVHVASGRVYNVDYNPPHVAGKDNVTGEDLVQRPDDAPEAVLRRLKIYSAVTEPMEDFFRKKGVLKEFSGTSSDDLWKSIEEALKKFMRPKSE